MAIREGAWDCPVCGRKGNRGPAKFCGGCGAPRGPEVRFYLPEDAREVTGEAELERARAGPDWICPFCGGDNRADDTHCTGCGAPRDGARTREVVEHRGAAPRVSPASAAPPPQTLPPQAAAAPPPPARSGRRKGLVLLALALLAALFWWLGRPREATFTVAEAGWERTVEVEALRTVVEEAWEGEVPAGARILSSWRDVHHRVQVQVGTRERTRTVTDRVQTGTERVKVGERDLGNGYFEDVYEDRPVYEERTREETYEEPVYREDPVYALRLRYEIDRWLPARTARQAGGGPPPRWPDPRLGPAERAGPRRESYTVVFADPEGRRIPYRPAGEEDWRRFTRGSAWKALVRRNGEIEKLLGPA